MKLSRDSSLKDFEERYSKQEEEEESTLVGAIAKKYEKAEEESPSGSIIRSSVTMLVMVLVVVIMVSVSSIVIDNVANSGLMSLVGTLWPVIVIVGLIGLLLQFLGMWRY